MNRADPARKPSAADIRELSAPRVTPMGSAAVLFEAEGPLRLDTQRRIWALSQAAAALPGVLDRQPGMNNLLVIYDPLSPETDRLADGLLLLWREAGAATVASRLLELPVVYGGPGGEDLDAVAARLGMPRDEVVRLHASAEYTVFAPGAGPGFGYLFGLPEPLFLPRRDVPVNRPKALNVLIAGLQCNISNPPAPGAPKVGPTGWYALGQIVAPVVPFDLSRDPPSLVEPGDRIRFIPVRIDP